MPCTDQNQKPMKKSNIYLLVMLAALALASCSPHGGRTIAMGIVQMPDSMLGETYFALVPNLDPKADPCEKWMRWEPWEVQDMYNITAKAGQTIDCMWISKCDFDTLGQLTLTGIRGKQKTYGDTLLLDGSHYVRGTDTRKTKAETETAAKR